MRRLKSLICDEDGAELAEFAIAATIFFGLFFGVITFCQVIYAGNMVAYAAQQGSRYAMVRGKDWTNPCATINSMACYTPIDGSGVQSFILSLPAPGPNFTASNITVTPLLTNEDGGACAAWTRGCRVTVLVSYPYQFSTMIFSKSISLTSTSTETIQD
jgi:Flp pilus assembly protein TadG